MVLGHQRAIPATLLASWTAASSESIEQTGPRAPRAHHLQQRNRDLRLDRGHFAGRSWKKAQQSWDGDRLREGRATGIVPIRGFRPLCLRRLRARPLLCRSGPIRLLWAGRSFRCPSAAGTFYQYRRIPARVFRATRHAAFEGFKGGIVPPSDEFTVGRWDSQYDFFPPVRAGHEVRTRVEIIPHAAAPRAITGSRVVN